MAGLQLSVRKAEQQVAQAQQDRQQIDADMKASTHADAYLKALQEGNMAYFQEQSAQYLKLCQANVEQQASARSELEQVQAA